MDAPTTGEFAHIGKSVVIKGEVSGSEDLYVDGSVEGKIELRNHSLTVGPNGNIKADVIAKATRVDGVYDKDPLRFTDAVKFDEISYLEVLSRALGVMDATSIAMCRDNKLPILVFNLNTAGNIMRMSMGEPVGTVIH